MRGFNRLGDAMRKRKVNKTIASERPLPHHRPSVSSCRHVFERGIRVARVAITLCDGQLPVGQLQIEIMHAREPTAADASK